jgi:hypothetical protein
LKNKKVQDQNEEIAQEIVQEFERVQGDRGNWESHWQEIADRMLPAHSRLFTSRGTDQTQGDKRTDKIFDSTAQVALKRFAAILDSLLTPRNQIWHRLMPSDRDLAKEKEVRVYFEEVNRTLFKLRYANDANFSMNNQQSYISVGAYGTGCMFIDSLRNQMKVPSGLRYRNIHLSEIYFIDNHQGIVDQTLRHFYRTARQAFQMWGDKTPENIKAKLKDNPNQLFPFVHCVKLRTDYDPERADIKGMPFVSHYVALDGKKHIQEDGYNSFPYSIARYEQAPNETYGRGPAMDVLPAVKTLNEQKKTMLKAGHRMVDPVLLAHDDGVADVFSMKPGYVNAGAVTADGRPLVQALQTGNYQVGKDMMMEERQIINDSFLINLFQIMVDSPQKTATEVAELAKEKGILLAPTIGRLQSEYLGTMVDRELDLCSEMGLLPPMPEVLLEAKGEYHIEYESPLSRAQRAEEASGVMRSIEAAINVVNVTQDHSPLDHFNWDAIIPEVAEIQAVPARWMRSMDEVLKLRQGRAQQQQEQATIQAAPAAAAMVKAAAVAQKG